MCPRNPKDLQIGGLGVKRRLRQFDFALKPIGAKQYSSTCDFENQAVSGYAKPDTPNPGHYFAMRSDSCNIVLMP
jgi:hypothetical protein